MLIVEDSIKSVYVKFHSFFENKKIAIPIFQRFYAWKEHHTKDLLNDLLASINNKDKNLYLLDFIYYYEDGKIKLADGQQRMISINMLRLAINEYIKANNIDTPLLKIYDISYDIEKYNKKYVSSFSKDSCPVAPFKKIFLYFSRFVQENSNFLPEIIDVLNKRIYIFAKRCSTADDAFSIFQQINTGGKPLSKEEIIKTSIDQYAKIYETDPPNISVKNLKQSITSYYKFLEQTTNANFDSIAIMSFLKKDIVNSKESFVNFVNATNNIENLSNHPIVHVIRYINRPQLHDIFNVLLMMNINIDVKKEYINKLLLPLCLLSISLSIKKSNPGGIIRTLYTDIISYIKNSKNIHYINSELIKFINQNTEICKIDFNQFKDALGDPDVSLGIKKAILIMDVIRHNTSSVLVVENINLEHVYPKKPGEWAGEGWPTSDEESSLLINNIGNFLLLNEEINKKIKNKYIDDKLHEYKKIIPNDLTLKTEMNTVDFEQFKQDKGKYIKKRQQHIAELVYRDFPLAQVIITKKD